MPTNTTTASTQPNSTDIDDTTNYQENMAMRRLKKIVLVVLPIVVVIVVAIIVLSAWSSGPSEGSVRTLSPKEAATPAVQLAPLPVDTAMFSAVVPGGFIKQDTSAPNPPVLSVRTLVSSVRTRQQVGFAAGTLPSDGLSGLGDYNLRTTQTASYKQSSHAGLPIGSVAFEDTTGSMVTLFWPHGGNYAEVTVSGDPATTAGQYTLLSKILQSWQWK